MRKQPEREKRHFFSEKLEERLAHISRHPLTVVQAPSGFGKTAAVREHLRSQLPSDARQYWYTCLGEPAEAAWRGVCAMLGKIDSRAADGLARMGSPTAETLPELAECMRAFDCLEQTYAVIDNYHLLGCGVPHELIYALLLHGSPGLHFVILTQPLGPAPHGGLCHADVHAVAAPALCMDRRGIAGLFQAEGLRLSESEAAHVLQNTGGWAAAVRAQLEAFRETGGFPWTAALERLVEDTVWRALSPQEQTFLLAACVLDGFSARQAAVLLGEETLPQTIETLLRYNDFIHYHVDTGVYTINGALREYLRRRLRCRQPHAFQNRAFLVAGQACAADGKLYTAMRLLLQAGAFEAALALPLCAGFLERQQHEGMQGCVQELVAQCPEEVLRKHPFALLHLAYAMLVGGRTETFRKLIRLLRAGAGQDAALRGEYTILLSYAAFNDVRKMTALQKKAFARLGGPSRIFSRGLPWTLGCPSVLDMFWREPGKLDDCAAALADYMPHSGRLVPGYGSGADNLLRAETLLLRGEDGEAEILCHRALYAARADGQDALCLCAELLLARIAIVRADVEGYLAAREHIRSYAGEDGAAGDCMRKTAELCLAVLELTLHSTEGIAQWLLDPETIRKTLRTPAVLYAQTVHAWILLVRRQLPEFYAMLGILEHAPGGARHTALRLSQLICLASAERLSGRDAQAREHLQAAFALALPDRVYLPFAQMEGMGDLIMELPAEVFQQCGQDDPRLAGHGMRAMRALCARQRSGVAKIMRALRQARSPLTPREREVALLAKSRLTAREIADKLYISESTVRTILRSVYSKLGIHSRGELHNREF